ncbi:MAG: hypothetical protein ABI051_13245 [Vicinamibacterales bacterium]
MTAPTRPALVLAACLAIHVGHASALFAQSTTATFPAAPAPVESADPSDTRLILMPTARTLPRGSLSVTLLDIFLPVAQFGVTDHVTVGAGTVAPAPGVPHPFVFLAKAQVNRGDRTQAAAGFVNASQVGEASVGLAYGVVTRGTEDDAWTGGAGWMYARSGDDAGGVPVAFFGFEHRISPHRKAIADVVVLEGGAFGNVGLRLMRTRFAADFAAIIRANPAGPLAGATITLGWRF